MAQSATLTSLPNELLTQIAAFIDDDTMYHLGCTCKILNNAILPIFHKRHNTQLQPNGYLAYHWQHHAEVPRFLRVSFFIQSIKDLHLHLRPDTSWASRLKDLRSLYDLISRLDSVGVVKISFLPKCSSYDPQGWYYLWSIEVVRLLNLILSRSCTTLYVAGDCRLSVTEMAQRSSQSLLDSLLNQTYDVSFAGIGDQFTTPPTDINRRFYQKILRKFRARFRRADPPLQLSLNGNKRDGVHTCHPRPGLHTFGVQSYMVLSGPFLEWTRSTLSLNCTSISSLTFNARNLTPDVWTELRLQSLLFPALKELSIRSSKVPWGREGVTLQRVRQFIIRHSTITTLCLEGLSIPQRVTPLTKPTLPHLRNLIANPRYVSWLLNPAYCSEELQSVTIASEFHRFDALDEGLVSVMRINRDVKLCLRFPNTGLHIWLEKHISMTGPTSIVTNLTEITHLIINTNYCLKFSQVTLELLSSWLALFPSLKTLELIENSGTRDEDLTGDEFHLSIAQKCPQLETLTLNSHSVSIASLRTCTM